MGLSYSFNIFPRIAPLVERLACNQLVGGSSPSISYRIIRKFIMRKVLLRHPIMELDRPNRWFESGVRIEVTLLLAILVPSQIPKGD